MSLPVTLLVRGMRGVLSVECPFVDSVDCIVADDKDAVRGDVRFSPCWLADSGGVGDVEVGDGLEGFDFSLLPL